MFAGIGGFSLGFQWAGIETAGLCEIDDYKRSKLEKRFPGVPLFGDIRGITGDDVRGQCGAVDIVCGGVPCQPVSRAGKRKGFNDDRWLWGEFTRIVGEIRPAWAVAENPCGFFDTPYAANVLRALEGIGYVVWPLVLAAQDFGLRHKRERLFIICYLSYAESNRMRGGSSAHVNRSCEINSFKYDCIIDAIEEIGNRLFTTEPGWDGVNSAFGNRAAIPASNGNPKIGQAAYVCYPLAMGVRADGISAGLVRRLEHENNRAVRAVGDAVSPRVSAFVGGLILSMDDAIRQLEENFPGIGGTKV